MIPDGLSFEKKVLKAVSLLRNAQKRDKKAI
jgi:hypothetical protein